MADINLFDDEEKLMDSEEEFEDELDEVEEERPRRERAPQRPARRKSKKKKKSPLVAIIIIVVIIAALGAAYYFFLGDYIAQFLMNRQITALSDVSSYQDVTAYAEAVVGARLKYDALDEDVKAKVDGTALTAAETASDAMRAARDTLAALPAADIAVLDYPAARTMIQDSRAAFDQLTDAQKLLVGETALTNAETLLQNCYSQNGPVIDLNDEVEAFAVSQDVTRTALDAEVAGLSAILNRAAALDQTLVNTAALSEKKAVLDGKLNQFSDITLNETSELSGYNYTLGGLIDGISEAVTSAEKSHGKYAYDTDAISATVDQVSATVASMQELTGPASVGIAALEHDYGADMNMQLTLLQGHLADALTYIKDTEVKDDEQVSTLTGYMDSAKAALKSYSDASQSYFAELASLAQSYVPFTDGVVGSMIEYVPFTGAAAAAPTETPADPTAAETPAAETPAEAPAEEPAEEGEAGYVNAEDVNFRDAPSTDGNSLGKQAKNTALRILGEDGDWYKVKIGDKTGYIKKDYVTKGNPD